MAMVQATWNWNLLACLLKRESKHSFSMLKSFSSTNTRRKMAASVVGKSVTNQEIARYWQQRHMLEEDHLYAAIKAAARLRALNLSDDDYLRFEDSLKENDEKDNSSEVFGEKYDGRETRVGIKDWWTKSKYAYLNQPAVKFVDNPRRGSYKPHTQFFSCKSVSHVNSEPWISGAICYQVD